MVVIVIPIVVCMLKTILRDLGKRLELLEIRKEIDQNHTGYSIVEISQNTQRSVGDLRRFAVTQTPVKDHRLSTV